MGCKQSTPVVETAAPPSTPVAAPSPEAAPSSTDAQPEIEITAETSAQEAKFAINGVSITEQGVVFYHVEANDESKTMIKRRFNDFKALYAKFDAATVAKLPSLPDASLRSYFRGRHNQHVMKERESQFATIVNAIANDPELVESDAFKSFLA